MEKKVIVGQVQICKAYGIGRDTFNELIEKGAPIKIVNHRYFVHTETMDAFFKDMSVNKTT